MKALHSKNNPQNIKNMSAVAFSHGPCSLSKTPILKGSPIEKFLMEQVLI